MPSIEGTYRLVSRDLPDGSVVKPPAVVGMLTFTKSLRNFNVMWTDKDGKHMSISCVAEYKLTPQEYRETPIFWLMVDEISGASTSFTAPAEKSNAAPVTVKEGKVSFKMPGEPPAVVIGDGNLTATAEGQFVDHWEMVQ